MSEAEATYAGWALVEQMGFRKTVGMIREVEQFGTKMLRLDVPFFDGEAEKPSGYATRFAGGPSLYQVSPLDEELALRMARDQSDPRPVRPTSFRLEDQRRQGAPPGERPEEGDDDPIGDDYREGEEP